MDFASQRNYFSSNAMVDLGWKKIHKCFIENLFGNVDLAREAINKNNLNRNN